MGKLFKKAVFVSPIFFLLLSISAASAHEKPEIDKIKDKTEHEVTLKVLYEKYKDKKVDIKVKVKNKKTDKKYTEKFSNKKLNSEGKKNVKIDDLLSNTKYSLKVKIKRHSGGDYSDWSDWKSAKTKGD